MNQVATRNADRQAEVLELLGKAHEQLGILQRTSYVTGGDLRLYDWYDVEEVRRDTEAMFVEIAIESARAR